GDGRSGTWFANLRLERGQVPTLVFGNDKAVSPIDLTARSVAANLYGEVNDLAGVDILGGRFGLQRVVASLGIPGRSLSENTRSGMRGLQRIMAKQGVQQEYVLSFMVKSQERSRLQVWMGSESQNHRAQLAVDLAAGQATPLGIVRGGWVYLDG